MNTKSIIKSKLIAPCGMNCALCAAYLRDKNKCPGCRARDTDKAISVIRCKIKNCDDIKNGILKFCFGCEIFPCARMKNLDKRYRTKYEMSMIENLEYIKKHGIRAFLVSEQKRWCKGSKIYCVHKHEYFEQI